MTKVMVNKQTGLIKLEEHDGEMRISSMAFVEHSGVTYKATNNLIKKHKSRLETFGYLPFEKDDKSKSGREIHALLNEDQAIFLLTLSKNTVKVVDFKHQLVTAFSKLRRKQALIDENHAKVKWQQDRSVNKLHRHSITDTIKLFVEYAQAQGSRGAAHYYSNISRCINKALCVDNRDEVGEDELALVAVAEIVAERSLQHSMSEQLPYKSCYIGLKLAMNQFSAMTQQEAA